jgi:hypothetical protein
VEGAGFDGVEIHCVLGGLCVGLDVLLDLGDGQRPWRLVPLFNGDVGGRNQVVAVFFEKMGLRSSSESP